MIFFLCTVLALICVPLTTLLGGPVAGTLSVLLSVILLVFVNDIKKGG